MFCGRPSDPGLFKTKKLSLPQSLSLRSFLPFHFRGRSTELQRRRSSLARAAAGVVTSSAGSVGRSLGRRCSGNNRGFAARPADGRGSDSAARLRDIALKISAAGRGGFLGRSPSFLPAAISWKDQEGVCGRSRRPSKGLPCSLAPSVTLPRFRRGWSRSVSRERKKSFSLRGMIEVPPVFL